MKRTNLRYIIILLLLIASGIYAYVYFSATGALGILEVTSFPSGALVYIDGNERGITPVEISRVPLGLKEISLKQEGYEPYSRLLHFNPNQRVSLHVLLSRDDFILEEIIHLPGSLPRGMLVGEESIYLFTSSGESISYSLESLSLKWQRSLDAIILSKPALGDGVVYGATFGGLFYSIHKETGHLLFSQETKKAVQKVVYGNGLLYLLHTDGTLTVWEGLNLKWIYEERAKIKDLFLDQEVVALIEDSLLFLDREEGILIHKLHLPGNNLQGLQFKDGSLYLTAGKGILYGVDVRKKEMVWEKKVVSSKITNLSSFEEVLYLATETSEVLAFHGDDLLFTYQLAEPVTLLFPHGTLLVGTERSLYFLDKEDGSLLARKALPSQITGILPSGDFYYLALRDGSLNRLTPGSFE